MAKGEAPTQKTTVELSPEQQQIYGYSLPYLQKYAATAPQRYQGSTIADFTPAQQQGQQDVLGAAGTIKDLASNAAGANQFYTSGDIWNPSSNQNLQGAIDASVRPIVQNYQEKVLPGIRSDAISTGNFGGSRQGVSEGIAARDTAQAIGDTSSKVAEDLYKTNVDAQLKAMGLLPTVQGAQTAGGAAESAVGDVQQAMNQARLNEMVQNFFADQGGLDYSKARDILALVQGMPGSTTVSTGSVPQGNPWMQSLGGAASGAALGSMLFPGIGTGIGALGGGLLPWLFK